MHGPDRFRTSPSIGPLESIRPLSRGQKPIESVPDTFDRRMLKRWCVAGLLRAESKFRRLKGHRVMPALLKALEEIVRGEPTGTEREVARKYQGDPSAFFNYGRDTLEEQPDHAYSVQVVRPNQTLHLTGATSSLFVTIALGVRPQQVSMVVSRRLRASFSETAVPTPYSLHRDTSRRE